MVKGTEATNESAIAQLFISKASDIQFFPGDRVLDHVPPTASTSLNVLFLLALYRGMTVVMDPRVSDEAFYNELTKLRPNVALTTGSAWEAFFSRVQREIEGGKRHDLSHATYWIVGGEETDVEKYRERGEVITSCGGRMLLSGYGSSALFSATCVEKTDARRASSKPVVNVGIPYAEINMGAFDSAGRELGYNKRDEL